MSAAIGDSGADCLTSCLSYDEHPLSLLTVKWGEAWRMGGNRAARRWGMNPLPHHPVWRTNYAQDGPGFPISPVSCNFRPSSSHCPHTSQPLTPETLPFSLFWILKLSLYSAAYQHLGPAPSLISTPWGTSFQPKQECTRALVRSMWTGLGDGFLFWPPHWKVRNGIPKGLHPSGWGMGAQE